LINSGILPEIPGELLVKMFIHNNNNNNNNNKKRSRLFGRFYLWLGEGKSHP
jgi:hypothetical protein